MQCCLDYVDTFYMYLLVTIQSHKQLCIHAMWNKEGMSRPWDLWWCNFGAITPRMHCWEAFYIWLNLLSTNSCNHKNTCPLIPRTCQPSTFCSSLGLIFLVNVVEIDLQTWTQLCWLSDRLYRVSQHNGVYTPPAVLDMCFMYTAPICVTCQTRIQPQILLKFYWPLLV